MCMYVDVNLHMWLYNKIHTEPMLIFLIKSKTKSKDIFKDQIKTYSN